jgi:hypothetical protein
MVKAQLALIAEFWETQKTAPTGGQHRALLAARVGSESAQDGTALT